MSTVAFKEILCQVTYEPNMAYLTLIHMLLFLATSCWPSADKWLLGGRCTTSDVSIRVYDADYCRTTFYPFAHHMFLADAASDADAELVA